MQVTTFPISGLLLVQPEVFKDPRGYFLETFSEKRYAEHGIVGPWVQDNESASEKSILRGLHLQSEPMAQAKLVRVIKGSVWDVAVDMRRKSPTFGKYEAVLLSADNKLQFYIPEGFAHGFLSLEDDTIFAYKCSSYYDKASEVSIRWDDPTLNIKWPLTEQPKVSEKDRQAMLLLDWLRPLR